MQSGAQVPLSCSVPPWPMSRAMAGAGENSDQGPGVDKQKPPGGEPVACCWRPGLHRVLARPPPGEASPPPFWRGLPPRRLLRGLFSEAPLGSTAPIRLPLTALLFPARLIDGINITMEDDHMWLIPFSLGEDHRLIIQFRKAEVIVGLRIWNYNKSPEDTYRGVSWWPGIWPAVVGGALGRVLKRSSSHPHSELSSSGQGGPRVTRRRFHLPRRRLPHPQRAGQLPL